MVYEPREDSFLIQRNIAKFARGIVCDMGTGSGILAREAAKQADRVFAVDIDPEAIQKDSGKIRFVQSDLFSNLGKKRFDLILFNAPYLPNDPRIKDIALDGGKHGHEVIERFLMQVPEHLNEGGKVLLLFSSLTNKQKVEELILAQCLTFVQVDSMKLDFEELFVYAIGKSFLLKELERKGVRQVSLFAKGHRGLIFTGFLRGKKIAVKTENPRSEAVGRIGIEAQMLVKLNKHGIGPILLFSGDRYFAYRFVEGEMVIDYIERSSREDILRQLQAVIGQLAILDRLGIDKEEMHHPVKHIIIGKKPVLIDFERAHHTERPKNLTQFVEFLARISMLLERKSIILNKQELITIARDYARTRDPELIRGCLK
jgi:HemK-related putative methylase